jgi:hypothetical protein
MTGALYPLKHNAARLRGAPTGVAPLAFWGHNPFAAAKSRCQFCRLPVVALVAFPSPIANMDIDEIDAFYSEAKRLQGPAPHWAENSRSELSASWNIEDSIGIVRAHLRFRCSRPYRQFPSFSVICRGNLVGRVDLVPATECKFNPVGAASLGLPAQVCGPHLHGWPDNREYVRSAGLGHMLQATAAGPSASLAASYFLVG